MTILSMPVIIFSIVSGYSLGLLSYFNVSAVVMLYLGYSLIFFLFISVMLFFENRYNYLVRRDSDSPSRRLKRAAIYTFNYLVAIVSVILMFSGTETHHDSREEDQKIVSCLPKTIFEKPNFFKLTVNLYRVGLAIAIYFLVIWSQIIFYFSATSHYLYSTKAQSTRTSQMQKQFFKILCIQISVPFVSIMVPAIYFFHAFLNNSVDLVLTIFGMMIISTHGLVSTLIMLIGHKPYREATLGFFRVRGRSNTRTVVGVIVAKPSISNMN
ncbi:unnamed protein product [Caenorhabditis brenneri]